jgi:hypothetical protein
MKPRNLLLCAACIVVAVAAFVQVNPANAQFPFPPSPSPGPFGPPLIHIPGAPGNNVWLNPGRFNPGAGVPLPGSSQSFSQFVPGLGWVTGSTWVGLDGLPHGNFHVPGSGFVYMARPEGNRSPSKPTYTMPMRQVTPMRTVPR